MIWSEVQAINKWSSEFEAANYIKEISSNNQRHRVIVVHQKKMKKNHEHDKVLWRHTVCPIETDSLDILNMEQATA